MIFCLISIEISRSARKSIEDDVRRRLPRKPWMEVKCPAELRELVYRARKPRKAKEKSPTKADHVVSDGKKATPIKNEVADGAAHLFPDEKPPILSQSGVPHAGENIGVPAGKGSISPVVGQVVAGDSGVPGKTGGSIGGTRVDEPIVIDD